MKDDLISIIIPVYNAEKFLKETIESVQEQTYSNWELLLIDDCSKDNSKHIIKEFIKNDNRIKYIRLENNSGAAIARNKGIETSNGKYICFLDADDKWVENKLEKQIKFMKEKDCKFSYTGYEFADENCIPNGKRVHVPAAITYKQALKNTTIWTSTVMLDMSKLSKEQVYMPNVKRGQDTATWWKILKETDKAYGLDKILSYYRRTENTLSSNKFKALKRTWNLYRNVEHLSLFYSTYNFCFYIINAIKRRI